MKKESLQTTTVKTLLAVLLFAGMGIIILGGGCIIWEYSKNATSNQIIKPADQETEDYYDALEKKCDNTFGGCCLFSVDIMRRGNYKEADQNGKCPAGFFMDMMKCITSYQWCVEGECASQGMKLSDVENFGPHSCCENLKVINDSIYDEDLGECKSISWMGFCSACGNKICDSGENKCNCPEDCGEEIDTSDWQIYRNEEFGFEIVFDREYKNIWGSKTHYFDTDIDSRLFARTDFYFKDYPLHTFSTISVYEKEWFIKNSEKRVLYKEWSAENNGTIEEYNKNKDKMKSEFIRDKGEIAWLKGDEDGYPLGTYLGENNDYVFVLGIGPNGCMATRSLCSLPIRKMTMDSFQITNTNNSWQTYRNEEFGFEFKYPSNLAIEKFNDKKTICLGCSESACMGCFSILKDVKKFDPEKVLQPIPRDSLTFEESYIGDSYYKANKIQIIFNSVEGNINSVVYFIETKNQLYQIRYNKNNALNYSENQFNQILSTFKFTEK